MTERFSAGQESTPGIELFFSYSHRDRELRDELERHLANLQRQGLIVAWYDRQIGAGAEWAGEIDAHLESAAVILLLISADFLSSNYCYDVEMKRALERHAAGQARVIPVILRAVEWQGAPFSRLKALPRDGEPVMSWTNRDEAFADVARGIREAVLELKRTAPRPSSVPTSAAPVRRSSPQTRWIDDESRGVVGRDYVGLTLDRFVSTHPRGYFIIEAGPGQGKTAIASRITRARGLCHYFIGRTGRRSDGRAILASLIEQLDQGQNSQTLASASVDDLTGWFDAALARRVESAAPVLLLFDALNELAEEEADDLPFLPIEGLPNGVYVILTSQPGERLRRITERLASVPSQVYHLPPLRADEVREMVLSRRPDASPSFIERASQTSLGNPLYLRAMLDDLAQAADVDKAQLPAAVEGYFRRATRALPDNPRLRQTLGLLAVSRKPLSLLELSQLTGASQRAVDLEGIQPIRQFLIEPDDAFAFYHERFHDFVVRELFYGDELRDYHRMFVAWMSASHAPSRDYFWSSLAYHLFHAGDVNVLLARLDDAFLAEKLRRFGYGVLEDLELLARALLEAGNPAFVDTCVARLDGVRQIVGGDIVDDVARSVQPHRVGARTVGTLTPGLTTLPGIDAAAILIPKGAVTADFIEVVRRDGTLVAAIGDAPSAGLKSAFVARFIATVLRSLAVAPGTLHLGELLTTVSTTIGRHTHFERVSLQAVALDLANGVMDLASAGHPYPLLYSARYGRCDRLPVRGVLLHSEQQSRSQVPPYELRHAEIGPGDVLVLVSDGITEAGSDSTGFSYRFDEAVMQHVGEGAKAIADAVLKQWRAYQAGRAPTDDAAILVLTVSNVSGTERG